MDNNELILMLGQLQGSVEASKENVNNKFETIRVDIKDMREEIRCIKTGDEEQGKRITSLETDRKVVMKLASVFGAVFGVLTTAIIAIGSSVVQFFFAPR